MVDKNRILSDYDVVDNAGLDIENANNVLSIKIWKILYKRVRD